jgi:hypothetical protein
MKGFFRPFFSMQNCKQAVFIWLRTDAGSDRVSLNVIRKVEVLWLVMH